LQGVEIVFSEMMNLTSTDDWANHAPHMGHLDLGVFAAMLAASAAIGCYFGLCSGRQDSALEYLMGGRSMGMLPVALSLVASFISGISIMGDPAEVYRHGTQYWSLIISSFFVSLVVSTVYAPLYLKMQLTSCYQVSILSNSFRFRFNLKNTYFVQPACLFFDCST
jgi:Na+/proline symporter